MASNFGTAIDDSFEPNFAFYQPSAPSGADLQSWYNGPRSGHWSVSSSIGSAIDDRCPTIWSADSAREDGAGGAAAHARTLDGGLLKRLGRATVEREAAAFQTLAAHAEEPEALSDDGAAKVLRPGSVAKPKGFYIPHGIAKARTPPAYVPDEPTKRHVSPSPGSARSEKPASINVPRPGIRAKAIRIKGKDGREVVMQAPQIPKSSSVRMANSISAAPCNALGRKSPSGVVEHRRGTGERVTAATRSPGAPVFAQRASQQREVTQEGNMGEGGKQQQGQENKKQQKASKPAPSAKIQGPPPKPTAKSVKGSAKDSAVGLGAMFEAEVTPKPPSMRSEKAISVKNLREAINYINDNSSKVKAPSACVSQNGRASWGELPSGVIGWAGEEGSQPAKPRNPASSNHEASQHPFKGFDNWDNAFSAADRAPSQGPYQHSPPQLPKQSNGPSPTVFAGKGWISPHPLSRESSPWNSPPQSHINLPQDHGGRMTYADWNAVQKGHRNFSRTESLVSKGVHEVAMSSAQPYRASLAKESPQSGNGYHKATVESDHGSQRAPSIRSLKESVRAVSKNSSRQSARWNVVPIQAAKDEGWGNAAGWDELPQFDGCMETKTIPSLSSANSYERQLNDLIAHYATNGVQKPSRPSASNAPGGEVQLGMPWDHSRSPSIVPPPSFQQSTLVTVETPPTPVYSTARSICQLGPAQTHVLSPVSAVPTPQRNWSASDLQHPALEAELESNGSIAPTENTSVFARRFAEKGMGGQKYGGYGGAL